MHHPASVRRSCHEVVSCHVGKPAAPDPQKGHDSVVQLLLDVGAAKDAANKHGWTPLNAASDVCF